MRQRQHRPSLGSQKWSKCFLTRAVVTSLLLGRRLDFHGDASVSLKAEQLRAEWEMPPSNTSHCRISAAVHQLPRMTWLMWTHLIWSSVLRFPCIHNVYLYKDFNMKKKNCLVIYLPHRNFSLRLWSQCRQIWFAFQIQTLGMLFCKWIKLGLFVHTVYSISNITTGVAVLMIETILSWEELSVWKVSTENSTFYLRLYLAGYLAPVLNPRGAWESLSDRGICSIHAYTVSKTADSFTIQYIAKVT